MTLLWKTITETQNIKFMHRVFDHNESYDVLIYDEFPYTEFDRNMRKSFPNMKTISSISRDTYLDALLFTC